MSSNHNNNNSYKIAFVHPDLGIGGAERFVVDSAIALQKQGNLVHVYTSHCDPEHCFEEVKSLTVTVWGDWIPRSVLGKFHLLFAVLRMLWVAFWILFGDEEYDVIFVDQVSYCIPLLKLTGAKILFYCHFPDKLLSKPGSLLKKLYRMPLDYAEEWTTKSADLIVANSQFTCSIVRKHFPSIKRELAVLYPTTFLERKETKHQEGSANKYFLSINRYEKKKNHELAVYAFAKMVLENSETATELVIVGGYDERVEENIRVYGELEEIIKKEKLGDRIKLLKNATDEQKMDLLEKCMCLIYTPPNEHFGIVPLEAMVMGKAVIASNSGGPRETVEDGVTGYLCKEDTAECFAQAMGELVSDTGKAEKMGNAGALRVKTMFGPRVFEKKLAEFVSQLMTTRENKKMK